jgi:hypothetical protein
MGTPSGDLREADAVGDLPWEFARIANGGAAERKDSGAASPALWRYGVVMDTALVWTVRCVCSPRSPGTAWAGWWRAAGRCSAGPASC